MMKMSKRTIILISVLLIAINITLILLGEYVVINLISLMLNGFNIGFTMGINIETTGKSDVVSEYINENIVILDEMPGVYDMHNYITCDGKITDDGSWVWICIKDNTQVISDKADI